MQRTFPSLMIFGALLAAMATVASAQDAKDEAVKKDRQTIEGTWRVVALVVDGKESSEEEVRKITVVNGSDGTWQLRVDGKEISRGTSTIDPTEKPKTIDFTPTEGDGRGDHYLGIYRLGKNKRRLCFAQAGKERPTKFASEPGSGDVFVTFERE